MKTVKAIPTASKPITLSKAAKFLSQFVSVENGASQAISAYLRRASAAFNELNQVHKHISNPHSEHKHKRNRSDNVDGENNAVEDESLQFWDKQGKHQKLIKEEDQSHSVPRSGQGHNPALSTNMGIEDGIENRKEKKKKKSYFEAKISGDHEGDMRYQDEMKPVLSDKFNQEPDHKVDNDTVREIAEKKHKKDQRKKKKDKASNDDIDGSGEVHNIRFKVENHEMEIEDVKGNEKKQDKSGNGAQRGSDRHLELQNGKIRENNRVEKKVKADEKKKRKNDDVDDRQEDGSSELHSKKKRRKKSEDDN